MKPLLRTVSTVLTAAALAEIEKYWKVLKLRFFPAYPAKVLSFLRSTACFSQCVRYIGHFQWLTHEGLLTRIIHRPHNDLDPSALEVFHHIAEKQKQTQL